PLPADTTDLSADEPEFDEPDYTPPLDEFAPPMAEDELGALDDLEVPAEIHALFEEQIPDELGAAGLPADLLAESAALEETAAALGLVDISRIPEDIDTGPDDLAWDAAASAVAAESAPPAEEAWNAAAFEAAPPAEEAWDAAVSAVAAEETPVVEVAPVTPEELDTSAEVPEPASGNEDEDAAVEPIDFSDDEWAIFSQMMRGFTKPASFQQIFDTLRGQRKEHNLTRTNEQLRTMVKQAINSGLLERSGRGKRVYYTLRPE
ncbi:MAG: NYN domain-containing protein, partial [Chloroflexales bacterium]|nr:NYN domain-containing protein [Chloroflexales bacterium]